MEVGRRFFKRDTKEVAKDLLGCKIIKRGSKELKGKIVETEAYFGPEDPASRASNGKTKISKIMWREPGTILIYVVHSYNLFNLVTERTGKPGAVLIRSVEPLQGIEKMKELRGREDAQELCSGPGKFTEAFGIKKNLCKENVEELENFRIMEGRKNFEIGSSRRIGVNEDLNEDLRFFIKGNRFLSR